MIRPLLLISLALACSCQNRSSNESAATQSTSPSVAPDTLCFQQIMGRDTTTLRLITHEATATGFLDINPYEKDRAKGSIQGTVKGNQIQATWDRSGEGVTQRYALDFTLKADAITWYEGERVEKQGVWVLKEPNKGYAYVLTKTDCP